MRGKVARPLADRFNDQWLGEPNSGCWLWMGTIQLGERGGYGFISIGKTGGRALKAHRVSWELHRGPIPDGLWVLHKCDTRSCVNPLHLFLGTALDNATDRDTKGRRKPLRGERHGGSKLTAEQVASIRCSSASHAALGREYGVSDVHIGRIRAGANWKLNAVLHQ